MTVSRKIMLLVGAALLICGIVFSVALFGLASTETALGQLAGKAASVSREIGSLQQTLIFTRTVLIAVLVAGILLLGLLGWLLQRALVAPLRNMEAAISGTADNLDFCTQIPVDSADEIGRALLAYNRLLDRLRGNFAEIQQSIANLLDTTEEVDHSSRRIARNSQVQSDASTNMAAAVEQMTVSISMVAEHTDNASQHTQHSRDVAEKSAEVILHTVGGIKQISDSVREAAERIKALRSDCDSIASMAKIIREIADQTNLLALNAAIEAARAGEQGRGFAVVADEVRKLAERTTASTQEISNLLNHMQDSARLAVDSMGHTENAVEMEVGNASQAGESIAQIKTSAEDAASVVSGISSAMREQETASSIIARHIEQIAQISEQNSSAASASANSASKMTLVGREVANILSAYKVTSGPQKIVLRSADNHPDDHPAVRAVRAMAEMLEKRTDGRITLKVFSNSAFGTEKETLEQVQAGTLDMVRANSSAFNKDCPATIVPSLPFLFSSIDHMHRALDGAPGQEILASCEPAGFIGLALYDSGARSIYAGKPIHSIADMRDLKLRVMPSDLWVAVASAMGARATPMAMDEIITGYRTGLVDGAENNIPTYDSYKHFEAFKYFCLTEHSMAPELLVFSKKRWATLAEEDRAIIANAARESVSLMRRYWHEREDSARKNAAAAGAVFVADVNKASFRDAMRPVYNKFLTTAQQKALFQAIQSMK